MTWQSLILNADIDGLLFAGFAAVVLAIVIVDFWPAVGYVCLVFAFLLVVWFGPVYTPMDPKGAATAAGYFALFLIIFSGVRCIIHR